MSEPQVDNAPKVDEEVAAPPEQAVAETAPPAAEHKTMASVGGVSLSETQFPLAIVLVASIVLIIALDAAYDWKNSGVSSYAAYLISVASIAMILSFGLLLVNKGSEDTYEKIGKPSCMLMFLYSFVGGCFLTFKEPFEQTGNGYFASWALVYGSAMTLGMKKEAFGSAIKGLGAVMGLLVSSIVVIIATLDPISKGETDHPNRSEAIYGLALACVTAFVVLGVLGMDKKDKELPRIINLGMFAILAVCWIVEACLVTFRGPFEVTGNGYFASWAAAATCTMAAFNAKD